VLKFFLFLKKPNSIVGQYASRPFFVFVEGRVQLDRKELIGVYYLFLILLSPISMHVQGMHSTFGFI